MAEQKFEDAFQKLESIVKKLEDGKLSLEESLKAFEEGIKLSRLCAKKLDEADRRVDLLICDVLGFVPFDRAGGELLFNLLSDRCERRSTIVTTNLSFSEWVQVFS